MRITGAEVLPLRIPKKSVFTVAYATRTACLGMLLKLTTDEGLVGWGEAVPVVEVTGEDRREVYGVLARWSRENLPGVDPLDRERLRLTVEKALPAYPSARCAVDTALWDLRGQALGQPLTRLLGGARQSHQASMSMGIKGLDETLAEARQLLAQGFGDIKVKIGHDLREDVARVRALRAELGAEWRLYLDANQGYSVDEATTLVEALAEQDVEFIEQPVKAEDLDGLAAITRRSPIPIAADEAVKDPASLVKILTLGAAHMVNVKLMKCGGPSAAETMVRMAEAAGLKAMVGCMIESRVGITAGLSVALALDNVHYIDLDGCLDLADDVVARGGARLVAGRQMLAGGPGLGIVVDEAKVALYRDEEVLA